MQIRLKCCIVYITDTKMKKKQKYVKPEIVRQAVLCPGCGLLGASIVDKTTIKSVGQDVQNYDFSDPSNGFNTEWQ